MLYTKIPSKKILEVTDGKKPKAEREFEVDEDIGTSGGDTEDPKF